MPGPVFVIVSNGEEVFLSCGKNEWRTYSGYAMLKRILILIPLLVVVFYYVRIDSYSTRPFRVIPSPPSEGFSIYSKDAKNGVLSAYLLIDAGKPYWTPDIVQVRKVEAALPAYLIANPPALTGVKHRDLDLSIGCRQYFGMTRNGKKVIYVNAVCSHHADCGSQGLIECLGGGFCYFHVFYDLGTSEFSGLSYNAPK